jgi:non-specific serine/threonine protein kinase
LLEEARDAQEAQGDQAGIALTMHLLQLAALWGGDLSEAQTLGDQCQAALARAGSPTDRLARIESARSVTAARTALELGDVDRAETLATQAAALALARDDQFWFARALHLQALVAGGGEQSVAGLRLIERAVALQRTHRDTEGLVDSLCALGHVELSRGRVPEAMGRFAEALRLAEQTGERIGLVWALEGVASGLVFRQPEHASKLAAACETLRGTLGFRPWPSQQRRNAALLPRARTEPGDSAYRAARAVGRRWSQSDAVRFVHGLASKHWSAQAITTDSLTAREEEVATLLVQGLSNKQIAAQLEVSVGTVRAHVDHILGKLGLHSRTQVAVWASVALDRQRAT